MLKPIWLFHETFDLLINIIHKAPHEPSWLELARERAFQAELEPALNQLESLKAWLEKLEPTFKKLELAREPIISINLKNNVKLISDYS
jgi:hypothetical protein